MESEKVKEIKKALENNANYEHYDKLGYIDGYKCKTVAYADILTYINELESENAYKQKEKWLTIIMAISTVIAMVLICLVPFNKGDMVRSLIIILLIIGLAFISNTLNIIALAQNKEKYGKKD